MRVLPAAVFDDLARVVNRYGGVGRWQNYEDDRPCCIFGFADFLDRGTRDCPHRRALRDARITIHRNDVAVFNESGGERISFARWCELLQVERGT